MNSSWMEESHEDAIELDDVMNNMQWKNFVKSNGSIEINVAVAQKALLNLLKTSWSNLDAI